jgi:hypothetical protein
MLHHEIRFSRIQSSSEVFGTERWDVAVVQVTDSFRLDRIAGIEWVAYIVCGLP